MLENLDYTHIGKNSYLNGDFIFSHHTILSGHMEGQITATKNASLKIEMSASVKGKMKGYNLEIYGEFEGEIESLGTVKIFPTAQVNATIKAQHIEVLPGARVNMTAHTQAAIN